MKKIFNLLVFGIAFLAINCSSSDDGNDNNQNTPTLSQIEISSSNGNTLDLFGDNNTTLSVSGKDQFGATIQVSGTINWSSNNNNVTVNSNGLVTAISVGTSIITANVSNISKTFNITIVDTTPLSGTFIYVSDAVEFSTGPYKIVRYDDNGSNPISFITESLAWPQDILFLEDDNVVLVSNLSSGNINKYNATTGLFIETFASGIDGPTRMKIGPDNKLYVLQWSGNGLVLRYELNGTFIDEFTSVGVSQSIGMDWDANNNLYVSSFGDALIRKFDSSGNDMGLFTNSNLQGPTNIWFDNNGDLLVNDWSGNSVEKFDQDGNYIGKFISSGLVEPEGVDFLPNGDVLIGSGGTSEVKQYDSNGNLTQTLVSSGLGGLIQPNAIRVRIIE